MREAAAIALLPRRYFRVGLQILRDAALEEDVAIAYLLRPFFTYVEQKWINNPNRRRWMSFYGAQYRTNNACETHNRMLRSKVGAHRPNIYVFIQALATLEHNASLDTELQIGGGNARRPRREQSVYTDTQLKNLCRDLEMDIFHDMIDTVKNFLERAAQLFHSAFEEHVLDAVGRRNQAAGPAA